MEEGIQREAIIVLKSGRQVMADEGFCRPLYTKGDLGRLRGGSYWTKTEAGEVAARAMEAERRPYEAGGREFSD